MRFSHFFGSPHININNSSNENFTFDKMHEINKSSSINLKGIILSNPNNILQFNEWTVKSLSPELLNV